MSSSSYVSDELSHFVGRNKPDAEQYDLLVEKILKPGWLTHPPHDPNQPRGVNLDLSKPISTDEAIKYQVVCFCDIPVDLLAVHVGKYSKFGLAFKKTYLIDRGACPVFYVANESPIPLPVSLMTPDQYRTRIDDALARCHVDRALWFDTSVKGIFDLLRGLDGLNGTIGDRYFTYPIATTAVVQNSDNLKKLLGLTDSELAALSSVVERNSQLFQTLRISIDFLCNYVFSYIKCFDAKKDIADESNYYMEREWRLAGNLHFGLGDVCRVLLPKNYLNKFRHDLPEYRGAIAALD